MQPSSGLVKITVTSDDRRVDLLVPGAVPVAELVPELARSVGLLDVATVHGGYRLHTLGGRELATDAGLTVQGIEDGAVVAMAAAVWDAAPRLYDDVAEAMADSVACDVRAWSPADGWRARLTAAVLLLAVGAVTLVALGRPAEVAPVAVGLSAALVAVAIVMSRVRQAGEVAVPVAVAWSGVVFATVAGLVSVGDQRLPDRLATAGATTAAAAVVALVGLADGRVLLLPAVVSGVAFLAGGVVAGRVGVDPAALLAGVLSVAVLTGSVLPALALGLTGTLRHAGMTGTADLDAASAIDLDRVRDDARTAREILVAVLVSMGLLLVLVCPWAVSLGRAGTALAVLLSLVVLLRARRHRARSEVLVAVASGMAGLLSTAVATVWLHPPWRASAAAGVIVGAALALTTTLIGRVSSARVGVWGDVVEAASLLALLPLLVAASGLLLALRGLGA